MEQRQRRGGRNHDCGGGATLHSCLLAPITIVASPLIAKSKGRAMEQLLFLDSLGAVVDESLISIADVDAAAMRGDDTTAGEVVDGISIVVEGGIEGGIEFKERDVGGAFIRSKDETYALGE